MKKFRQCIALTLIPLLFITACGNQQDQKNNGNTLTLEAAQKAYLENVDVDYSFNLAKKMEQIRTNETLGYRTAGSQAELDTGDMLAEEMEAIGLSDVTKDEFILDGWTFEKARLTYSLSDGEPVTAELGGYQANFSSGGPKEYTLVYANQGTENDLASLDVQGKLVLIDINQSENWWINYPAYEAHLHGAAAVLAAQDGGYAEVSDEALNAQDICGPDDTPAFSISRVDADAIIADMQSRGVNEMKVTFDAESRVERDVPSYNIVGTIPGKDSDSMVLMSAHYDSYFTGFQDDNAAIALMFGIAKGIIDSGYQPERTLVFCAMAAEEWGVVNTRYDWSTGAYNQVFRVHPEWAGKVIADINFELPALDEGDADQIRASYELQTFLEDFKGTVPEVDGVFPDGIEVIVPTYTWSDDFSMSIAGIPATVTSLRGDFSQTHYHSQFDNEDTYSEEAFLFRHNLYGMLMLEYDRCAVSPLDFKTRLEAFKETIDESVLTAEQAESLTKAADDAIALSEDAWEKVQQANKDYLSALDSGDTEKAESLLKESMELNDTVLEAFKYAQDTLVRLTWEDAPIFPHEHSANNVSALSASIEALENGDCEAPLNEYLYLVDNNWYAYDWSRDTYDYFTDYVLNQPDERLMWGAGRVWGHVDLFDVINSLQEKGEGDDFSSELEVLRSALESETAALEDQVQHELDSLEGLSALLEKMAA